MSEHEAAFCPNCNKPAIRQGKTITCENCDMKFRYTQEGPRLHEIGPLEQRIGALEATIRTLTGDNHEPPPASPAEPPERDEDDDEDGI